MKITLLKKPVLPEDVGTVALVPVMPSDVDNVNKFGDGEIIQAEVKRDRFYPLTQKYWALCNLVANNYRREGLEMLDHKNVVDEYIKLKLNVIESRIVFPDGRIHVRTGSIANKAKDKDEFQEFYDRAVEVMEWISGIPRFELELNWHEYECVVQ
ncbi:MAG: hypothetical protein CVV49_00500 [Spirochaetae bacterium HGW-Spirochaetae-5]|nr:MAG: hypothetical protein CVV49_00500 [Spirochaetae bacterium HGW-Spirochaetae-5]